MLNGFAGAVALWRLWGSGHNVLWWSLLGVLVFSFVVNQTVVTAYGDAMNENPDASDPVGRQLAHWDTTRDPVVRFWSTASMVMFAISVGMVCGH